MTHFAQSPTCTHPDQLGSKLKFHSLHRFSKAVVMSMLQKGMGIREKSLTCLKDVEDEIKDDIINQIWWSKIVTSILRISASALAFS